MKPEGRKIVGVVVYDYQMAQVVDRAGVDIVSAGDSVGVVLWGDSDPFEVTLDQMVMVCRAVRRGVKRALVNCDLPYGPLQRGTDAALAAAARLVEEGGADLVKIDDAASFPETIEAIARAGIPVWAQFGITPHTAARYTDLGGSPAELSAAARDRLIEEAKRLEQAGASLLDFTHSGPVAGPAVVAAVAIPVMGGLGGGPWLDGRIRSAAAAIGYVAAAIDDPGDRYANVAATALSAIQALCDDVRAGRQVRGAAPPALNR
jgi:3-methyl-2-oxobutanoate hydroxymethyltransferase